MPNAAHAIAPAPGPAPFLTTPASPVPVLPAIMARLLTVNPLITLRRPLIAVHAITQAICISLLTKRWDDCENPIIYEDLIPFNEDYVKHMKSANPDYNPADNRGKN